MIDDRRMTEEGRRYLRVMGGARVSRTCSYQGKLGRKGTVSNPFQADYKTLTATDQN